MKILDILAFVAIAAFAWFVLIRDGLRDHPDAEPRTRSGTDSFDAAVILSAGLTTLALFVLALGETHVHLVDRAEVERSARDFYAEHAKHVVGVECQALPDTSGQVPCSVVVVEQDGEAKVDRLLCDPIRPSCVRDPAAR